MPDQVETQVIQDAAVNTLLLFTNVSDGSGETAATKVDSATLSGTPTHLRIMKIRYATAGMAVRILWDGPTDKTAWVLPADHAAELCFEDIGGLQNKVALSDATGNINFTTIGADSGDSYSVLLWIKKN
jgi:hypothetical protein